VVVALWVGSWNRTCAVTRAEPQAGRGAAPGERAGGEAGAGYAVGESDWRWDGEAGVRAVVG
jgi:hypothetical protein